MTERKLEVRHEGDHTYIQSGETKLLLYGNEFFELTDHAGLLSLTKDLAFLMQELGAAYVAQPPAPDFETLDQNYDLLQIEHNVLKEEHMKLVNERSAMSKKTVSYSNEQELAQKVVALEGVNDRLRRLVARLELENQAHLIDFGDMTAPIVAPIDVVTRIQSALDKGQPVTVTNTVVEADLVFAPTESRNSAPRPGSEAEYYEGVNASNAFIAQTHKGAESPNFEAVTMRGLMETKERQEKVTDALVLLTETCHGLAKEGGWWPEGEERDVGNMLMLIVSEVAEALEGDRKDLMDEHLPHHKMFDVEMADVLIRSFDIIGGLLADTAIAFPEKLLYNINRADHSKEARAAKGGKKY